MNRWEKFLRQINTDLRRQMIHAASLILSDQLEKLDVKPLHGFQDTYRCRVRNVRIIFERRLGGENSIKDVGFRKDIYKRWK